MREGIKRQDGQHHSLPAAVRHRTAIAAISANAWVSSTLLTSRTGMEDTRPIEGEFKYSCTAVDVADRHAWDEGSWCLSTLAPGSTDRAVVKQSGIGPEVSCMNSTPKRIDRCLDINLKGGAIYGAQAAYPYLQKRLRPGRQLINIASAAGNAGSAGMSVYCATNSGYGPCPKASMPNGRLIASPSPRFARASSKPRWWMARATASRTNRSAPVRS